MLNQLKLRQWMHLFLGLFVLIGTVTFFYEPKGGFAAVSSDQIAPQEGIFLPVVMYHGFSKNPSRVGEYVITPEMFEADMQYLLDAGYSTVFVSDLLSYVDLGVPLPQKPVLVTFDDGQYSILAYISPIMEKLGVKAVINVEGAFTETAVEENDPNPEYAYLTWAEITTLYETGLFEIGNHSYDMHYATGLRSGTKKNPGESLEDYELALLSDIGYMQDLLWEYCSVQPVIFAYPLGFISDESIPILDGMGFRVLLTCYERPNYLSIDPGRQLILNRYNRSGNLSTEAFMALLLHQN